MALFKLRIVAALLLAAIAGASLAADGHPDWRVMAWLVLAGASALNEYLEREQDTRMLRTRDRRPSSL